MDSTGELTVVSGTVSVVTTHPRTGTYCLRMNPSAATVSAIFRLRTAGGTFTNFAQSFRFYLYIASLPSSNAVIAETNTSTGTAATSGSRLTLNTDGTLTIAQGNGSVSGTSSLALSADATWHLIDVDASGTNRTLFVDGVQWAQATGAVAAAAQGSLNLGTASGAVASTFDIFVDDLMVDNSTSSGGIGAGAALLLIPTAGNAAGSWTDGAGGTGDIHGSVDNIPPIGVAASTAGAKIKNGVSGTALDYVATMQTYLAAGIPAGSIINAIQAICNDGEEVATGTKSGGIWCASNPAQSAVTVGTGVGFDYGDNAGALATFPTGWVTHFGIVASAPSVTLGTAPTVTVRKGSSTTRVVDVDFMGLYVDYTPPFPWSADWAVAIEQPYRDKTSVVPY